jgi:hypothetical protein
MMVLDGAYFSSKGDYYRYPIEISLGDEGNNTAAKSVEAYKIASALATTGEEERIVEHVADSEEPEGEAEERAVEHATDSDEDATPKNGWRSNW